MTSIEPLIGIAEVAKLLSCSTMAVRKWTKEGLIPHFRIGMGDPNKKMYKFRKSEVMEWLESKRYNKGVRAASLRYRQWHKGIVIQRSYD
jgi:excisionase family DNA binding protein